MSEKEIIEKCKIKKKPLEALHTIAFNTQINGLNFGDELRIIEQALQRLEAIDNANPNEALKELEQDIKDRVILAEDRQLKLCAVIKQALIKSQEQGNKNACFVGGRTVNKDIIYLKQSIEQCNDKPIFYMSKRYGNKYIVPQKSFEDQAQVLKILKEKKVDTRVLRNCLEAKDETPKDYNFLRDKHPLTQEEFDLLKRYYYEQDNK